MPKQPGLVPIAEVGEYTDQITIGELGLPVGFDLDQLQLHVGRTLRMARFGSIGHLGISGFRGEVSEQGYGIGGISDSGVGTATGAVTISKAELHASEGDFLHEYYHGPGYAWHNVKVKVNNAEIEERIRNDGDKWDRSVFDPFARAKYMNSALKKGMLEATKSNMLGEQPGRTIMSSALLELTGVNIYMLAGNLRPLSALALRTLVGSVSTVANHGIQSAAHKDNKVGHPLPPRMFSLARNIYYDRLAMMHAVAPFGKLVTAKR